MPMPRDSTFGTLLRRYRLAAGLTQGQLARRAGLSERGVSDLERGRRRWPRPGTVHRLAEALALPGPDRAALSTAARGGRPAPAPRAPQDTVAARPRTRPVPPTPLV